MVLNKAVACFAHLYPYGVSKCTFLAGLTGRPIHNLEDVNCPPQDSFNHERWCTLTYHKFPNFSCATKTAHSLYDCLLYYLKNKDFVQCRADMTRYTADFFAALYTGRAHRPPSHSAPATIATRRKRFRSSDSVGMGFKRMKLREEQLPSHVCSY